VIVRKRRVPMLRAIVDGDTADRRENLSAVGE
jgi:hypothetical protein